MMEKETYWSKYAGELEEKTNHIVGEDNIRIIQESLSTEKDMGKTLELGCGNGTYSAVLEKSADHLTATDFSDVMVEITKKRFAEKENVTVEKANCFELDYPENSFDTVFMANLLHVIPAPEKSLQEASRVLKKGGRFIIISYTSEGMTEKHTEAMRTRYLAMFGTPSPHASLLTVQKARNLVEASGFTIDQANLVGDTSKAIFISAVK